MWKNDGVLIAFLQLGLIALSLLLIQWMIGGTRLLFAFPAYTLLALAAIASLGRWRERLSAPGWLAIGSALALVGYVGWRGLTSPVAYLAWRDLGIALSCLIAYLLMATQITTARQRMMIAGVLLIAGLGEALLGLLQAGLLENRFLSGLDAEHFLVPLENREPLQRASGTFVSANHYAGFLEMVTMVALAIGCWSRWSFLGRAGALGIAGACAIGVVISGSRGGYVSLSVAVLLFALISVVVYYAAWRRRLLGSLAVAALGLSMATLGVLEFGVRNPVALERFNQGFQTDIRQANWQAALDQSALNPWYGTGAGTHLIYGRFYRRAVLQVDPIHAHNDYLEMLAEYGRIGLTLGLLFAMVHLGQSVIQAAQLARRRLLDHPGSCRSNALALQLGAFGALVAMLTHSVFDFNLHIPGNALTLALLLGIVANGSLRMTRPYRWATVALPLLGGLMLWAIVPRWEGEAQAEKARVALREGKFHEAKTAAARAVATLPANPYAWFHLGESQRAIATLFPIEELRRQNFNIAIDAYLQGLERFPQDTNLLIRLAQALEGAGRAQEAEETYRRAILQDPRLTVLRRAYEEFLKRQGRPKAAFHLRWADGPFFEKPLSEMEAILDHIRHLDREENQP